MSGTRSALDTALDRALASVDVLTRHGDAKEAMAALQALGAYAMSQVEALAGEVAAQEVLPAYSVRKVVRESAGGRARRVP